MEIRFCGEEDARRGDRRKSKPPNMTCVRLVADDEEILSRCGMKRSTLTGVLADHPLLGAELDISVSLSYHSNSSYLCCFLCSNAPSNLRDDTPVSDGAESTLLRLRISSSLPKSGIKAHRGLVLVRLSRLDTPQPVPEEILCSATLRVRIHVGLGCSFLDNCILYLKVPLKLDLSVRG